MPHGPPPRSGHASVVTPQSGGSIYIHGGEFSSKNGESFYHYKDFWCLTVDGKNSKWEEIKVKRREFFDFERDFIFRLKVPRQLDQGTVLLIGTSKS